MQTQKPKICTENFDYGVKTFFKVWKDKLDEADAVIFTKGVGEEDSQETKTNALQ